MSETLDASNDQFAGVQGDAIVVALAKRRMSRAEALRHAAWLVTLADPDGEEFAAVLEAVRRT